METALMITILLVLMFGIIDLGRALFTENNLVSAAREGARYGAAYPTNPPNPDSIKLRVKNHFSPFGGPALTDANITVTNLPATPPYESVQVKITYPFTWITPIQRFVGSMKTSFHAQAEYHLEQQ
jgi:Flp pilus assembly protein TadG